MAGALRFQEFENGIGLKNTYKTPSYGLKFDIVGRQSIDAHGQITKDPGIIYLILGIYPFKQDPLRRDAILINSMDQHKLFAILKDDFDRAIADGFIQKTYKTYGWNGVTYGASLSLPLKLRPRIDAPHRRNREITTDVSIGGYVGFRTRVHPTLPFYLTPIVSAGMVLLPIGETNMTDGSAKGANTVPGFTVAGGLVIELDKFNLGLMFGRDYASGTQGDSWAYNAKMWYSLSIGFSFFGKGAE